MLLFYNDNGDSMKIYLDVILFLNFAFDFLLLMAVNILLKRNAKIKKMVFGALIGGSSIFILFIPMSSFTLFIVKIIISIFMIITTFGFRDKIYFFKNFIYLYSTSMVLGGILYYLNTEFSYKQEGLVFYHDGLSINFIFLVLTSPFILYIYIRQVIHLKNNYQHYYQVTISINNKLQTLNAFLDTGNKMIDPYFKRPILLIDKKRLIYDLNEFQMILVPIDTANRHSMLSCIKPDYIDIKNIGIRNKVLIGLLDEKIDIDGIDCLISEKILEG